MWFHVFDLLPILYPRKSRAWKRLFFFWEWCFFSFFLFSLFLPLPFSQRRKKLGSSLPTPHHTALHHTRRWFLCMGFRDWFRRSGEVFCRWIWRYQNTPSFFPLCFAVLCRSSLSPPLREIGSLLISSSLVRPFCNDRWILCTFSPTVFFSLFLSFAQGE